MTSNGSNRLPYLVAQIKRAHADAQEAAQVVAARAIEAGQALVEAKALVKHGQWLPFLNDAAIPERTAQRYMTLATSDLQSDTVSLLGGITPTLRFLSLRADAGQKLRDAEAAALAGVDDGTEVVPIEEALDLIEEMVAMFPSEQIGRAA